MIVALYILIALVVVGSLLYVLHRRDLRREALRPKMPEAIETEEAEPTGEICCGMHIICEKDSLLASVSEQIEYYDDEELDRFRGRTPESYTDDETEEFRNVLLTLLPEDIAGWGRSIQLRRIELPEAVRQELFMIVAEARQAHAQPT